MELPTKQLRYTRRYGPPPLHPHYPPETTAGTSGSYRVYVMDRLIIPVDITSLVGNKVT